MKTLRNKRVGYGQYRQDPSLGKYLESLRQKNLSNKSQEVYAQGLARCLAFLKNQGVEKLQHVSRENLEQFQNSLVENGLACASIQTYMRAVRQFFGWLEEHHLVFLNPATQLEVPQTKKKLQYIPSEEDMERLLKQPDTSTILGIRDRALLETAYSTGARRAEVSSLEVADVDLEQGLVRVLGKGSKERLLPLGQEARKWIGAYLEKVRPEMLKGRQDLSVLWLNRHGRPLGYQVIAHLLRQYSQAAGLTTLISAHAIRRACATHMLHRGAHPVQLQMLLGHTNLQKLSHYLQLGLKELKATHAQSVLGR